MTKNRHSSWLRPPPSCLPFAGTGLLLLAIGCATAWRTEGSYYRTIQTRLTVDSETPARVYVDDKYAGATPLVFPLIYEQEVQKRVREVSYWRSQPGWSVFLTVTSLGVYLPFSVIPVDIETSFAPIHAYRANVFKVGVVAEGYEEWREQVAAESEETMAFQVVLEAKSEVNRQ